MVTCDTCGKQNGDGELGTNWICADCRVTPDEVPDGKRPVDGEGNESFRPAGTVCCDVYHSGESSEHIR